MSSKRSAPPGEGPPSSQPNPSSPPSGGRTRARGRGGPPRILVVDDSPICLDLMSLALEEGGYEVITVDSPFALSSALSAQDPDLVLVDVGMPGLPGDKLVEITMRNRRSSRGCPIVLHSDRPDDELSRLVEVSGAAGFIRKTSDVEVILKQVRRFLGAPP